MSGMPSAFASVVQRRGRFAAAEDLGCPDPAQHGRVRLIAASPSDTQDYISSASMSLDEFLNFDQEIGIAEWVRGTTYLYGSVTSIHQQTVGFISTLASMILGLHHSGRVSGAKYAVVSTSRDAAREPDVFFVAARHAERMTLRYFDGAPDLVVEVVSDDSVERDYVTKFREYEAEGYPEYWIIDPRPGHERADFYVLTNGRYAARLPDADGVYTSAVFPDVKFKVVWLFEETPPLAEALKLARGDRLAFNPGSST